MTANRKVRDLAAPHSSLNWYASEAARIVYASFSFCPPDLPPESAYVSYSLSSSRYRSEAVKVYQFRTSVTSRVHFWSASLCPSRP